VNNPDEGPQQADKLTINQYRGAWWGATALWLSVIFLASTWPEHGPPGRGIDKVLHLMAYAVLTALLFRCWQVTARRWRLVIVIGRASIIAISYGLLLELCQLRVPGRDFQWTDILANCTGVVAAALILLYSYRSSTTRSSTTKEPSGVD